MKTYTCDLGKYPRQLVQLVILGLGGLGIATSHAQPANDNFANAALITGQTAQVTGSNVGATMETGEPTTVEGWTAGQSIWWRWTANFTGFVGLSTAGSGIGNGYLMLAVYEGDTRENLSPVVTDSGASNRTTALVLPVTNGVTYRIAAYSWNGVTGAITLTLNPAVTQQTRVYRALAGGSATLGGVTVAGNGPFAYQWRKNGSDIAGATAATLPFSNIQLEDSGTYDLLISAAVGTAHARLSLSVETPTGGVKAIGAGWHHSLFVKNDGSLWTTGYNTDGQLGDGATTNRNSPYQVATGVASIASGGGFHSLFIKTDQSLWAMGNNYSGQLGDGTTEARSTPVQVGSGVIKAAAGGYHSLYIKNDATLWGMGSNSYGQLGEGLYIDKKTPVQLATGVAQAAAGDYHSLYVTTDGRLWVTGYNNNGQLGDGTTTNRAAAYELTTGVAAASAGWEFSVFLKTDGTLWGMGFNGDGVLGDGTTTNRSTPVLIARGVAAVSAGSYSVRFIKSDGSLWATGRNSNGQLGDGTTIGRARPVLVAHDVSLIASGHMHSASVGPSGALWMVGFDAYGQLGSGGNVGTSLPVQILPGLATAPAIAAQPQPVSVALGGPAEFAVGVGGGTMPWSYQWRRGGTDIAGATKSTFAIAAVAKADAGNYDVVITNPVGPTNSTAAALNVLYRPEVTSDLTNQTVVVGSNVTFTIGAVGNPAPTYQWRKDGSGITGATNATLSLPSVTLADAGVYDVHLSNNQGGNGSSFVTLTVNAPPAITAQPFSRTVTVGTDVTLTVAATGSPSPTFQWRKNGDTISNATSAMLTLANVQPADAGSYTVVVSNTVAPAAVSNAAVLVVNPVGTPTVFSFEAGQGYALGATGAAIQAVNPAQWFSVPGGSDATIVNASSIAGFGAQALQSGYTPGNPPAAVLLENPAGTSVATFSAQVRTGDSLFPYGNEGGVAFYQGAIQNVTGPVAQVYFEKSNGTPKMGARFAGAFVGGSRLMNVTHVSGAVYTVTLAVDFAAGKSTFTVSRAGFGQIFTASANVAGPERNYHVELSGGSDNVLPVYDNITGVAVLTGAPVITTQPQAQTAAVGSNVTFAVVATGTPVPTYQWKKDDVPLDGATNATLVLNNVQTTAAGSYSVVVSNGVGAPAPSSNAVLTVTTAGPANDLFANAALLSGTTATASSNTTSATLEPGEPTQSAVSGPSVWWKWVAPAHLTTTVDTIGSGYDTTVAIHRGPSLAELTIVAWNDDIIPSTASRATFAAVSGVTYYIQVYGWNAGNRGAIVLNLSSEPGPTNDYWANATVLTGNSAAITANNTWATREPGEPTHGHSTVLGNGTHSLWWKWTAPAAGSVSLNTAGSGYDTLLTVYTGSAVDALALVASNNDAPGLTTSALTFTAASGTPYFFKVDGYEPNQAGVTKLNLAFTDPAMLPVITSPATAAATVGVSFQYNLLATNSPVLSYSASALPAGLNLAPAAGAILGTPTAAGVFPITLTATNATGTGPEFTLTITVSAATSVPSFGQHPASQTRAVGQSVLFMAIATGNPAPTYQWRKNNTDIPGATLHNYGIASVQTSDAGTYDCVATNSAGSTPSNAAVLTVTTGVTPPTITEQPEPNVTVVGGAAAISVTATGTAPLSYQWRKGYMAIPGATTATLNLSGVTAADVGIYRVEVRNTAGSVTSRGATLTMGTAGVAPELDFPMPHPQTALVGQEVTFTVNAAGSPTLTYQWKKDDVVIPNATGAALTLSNVQLDAAGVYTATITNSFNSLTTSGLRLTVAAAAPANDHFANATAIGTLPASISGTNIGASNETGEPDHLGISESGQRHGAYSVWYHWTAPASGAYRLAVTPPSGGWAFDPLLAIYTGTSVSSLTLTWAGSSAQTDFFATGGVNYRIAVEGYRGATSPFTLSLATATATVPALIHPVMGQSVLPGQEAVFSVMVTGTQPMTYQWRKGTTNLANDSRISGATSNFLRISGAQTTDAGDYTVFVANAAGDLTTAPATLVVGDPVIVVQPQPQTVSAGASASFSAYALGTGQLTYRWQKGSTPLSDSATIAGASSANLALSNVQTADADTYRVVVTNGAGASATSAAATLTVNGASSPPAITSATSATATVGTAFSFQVTASNSPTTFAATGLPSGLTLSASTGQISGTPTTAGTYPVSLTATNGAGTSPAATLVITVVAPTQLALSGITLWESTATGAWTATNFWNTRGQAGDNNSVSNLYLFTGSTGAPVFATSGNTDASLNPNRVLTPGTHVLAFVGDYADPNATHLGFNLYFDGDLEHNRISVVVPREGGGSFTAIATGITTYGQTGYNGPGVPGAGSLSHAAAGLEVTVTGVSVLPRAASTDLVSAFSTGTNPVGGDFNRPVDTVIAITLTVAAINAAPANNLFANRIALSGLPANTTGTNVGADKESAEPSHVSAGGASVWWSWTAPASGAVTIATTGSDFDTLLGVYTGTAVGSLVSIASNDDASGVTTSLVTIDAVGGTIYQIAVDGYEGRTGNITLAIAAAGGTSAPNITTQPVAQTVTVGGSATFAVVATGTAPLAYQWRREGVDLSGATLASLTLNDVQLAQAGAYTVVVSNGIGTPQVSQPALLTVVTGGTALETFDGVVTGRWSSDVVLGGGAFSLNFGQLNFTSGVLRNTSNGGPATSLAAREWTASSFTRTADWQVQVDVNFNTTLVAGQNMMWQLTAANSADSSDLFAIAYLRHYMQLTSSQPPVARGSTFNNSAETANGQLNGTSQSVGTLRLTYVAATQTLTAWLDGDGPANGYSFTAVHSTTLGATEWNMGATDTFRIRLSAQNNTVANDTMAIIEGACFADNFQVTAPTGGTTAPANDLFANRSALTGTSATATGSNVGANKESGEPNHLHAGGASVWWTWTAPAAGVVTIDTQGSSFDTLLAVYTGTAVASLTPIASNDDAVGSTSAVTFTAVSGTTYQIAVDGFGGATGSIALRLSLGSAPSVPTINSPATANGTVGTAFSYTITATNSPTGFTATNLPNGLSLNGTTGVISGTPTAAGGTTATLIASNANGAGPEFQLVLTVSSATPPIITAPPRSQTALVGGTATFTVGVIGTPPFTYQWKKAGTDIPNATGVTLTLTNLQLTDAAAYTVAVTGSTTVTSQAALLTVATTAPANDLFANAAVLSGATSSTTGSNVGASLQFLEPDHAGHAEIGHHHGGASVWWKWVAPASGAFAVDTIGSNFDTLLAVYTGSAINALTLIGANDQGGGNDTSALAFAATSGVTYYFAVDGFFGAAGAIQLHVAPTTAAAPSFVSHPMNQTAPVGGNVKLGVVLAGTAPFTYQWKKDGVDLPGATTIPLSLYNITAGAAGSYTLVATNALNSATSNAGVLTVTGEIGAPSIVLQPVSQTVPAGGGVVFAVSALGNSPLTYQWRKGGVDLPNATGMALVLPNVQAADADSYTCYVANPINHATSAAAILTVTASGGAPAIVTPPASQTIAQGATLTLTVVASGATPLAYEWRKGGAALANDSRISGATTPTLTLTGALPTDSGTYTVVVSNSLNSATSAGAVVGIVPAGTSVVHTVAGGYHAGTEVTVTNILTYSGTLSGLTWQVLLPDGWSYAATTGGGAQTMPVAGTPSVLDWTWTTVPASPVTFTYTLRVPVGASAPQSISALATLTRDGIALRLLAQPEPLSIAASAAHRADTDRNFRISLSELTRVIELYNTRLGTLRTGRYKVQAGTEDGFAADPVSTTNQSLSMYHSADTDSSRGQINLTELTRVIELYNYRSGTTRTGQYRVQASTEDGFAPGP